MNLRWMLEVRGEQAVEINLATTSTAMRSSYILGCFCLLLLYLNVRLTTCALKVSKPKVWCYMMWCASMMCHSSRWNPHGLSLQYSIPSWNVRMPAPCPVPVITASSDTQNRLYKPARLPVRCLSGAKQGEIDPSMDHRNRFLRLIRQCFPTSTALQPFELSGRAQSFCQTSWGHQTFLLNLSL